MPKRNLIGKVVSNKMQKTLVVEVETRKDFLKYKISYKRHKKYKADVDNEKDYQIGDVVVIEETSPKSRDKMWKVVKKLRAMEVIAEEINEETKEVVKENKKETEEAK